MVDAWGKPNAGLLLAAIMWPGSYEECLSVESNTTGLNHSTFHVTKYEGQYCDVGAPVGSTFSNILGSGKLTLCLYLFLHLCYVLTIRWGVLGELDGKLLCGLKIFE